MEIVAIDGLLTLVRQRHSASLEAWTQAALFACELAAQEASPLWRALPKTLESAGWLVESSSQQAVALPQLAGLLRADPVLVSLLDRRGGLSLPHEASQLLDDWWQCSLGPSGAEQMVALVGTLDLDESGGPQARLYALTLPSPSWRWLVRAHLVQARLNRLSLRLDEGRHASLAPTLAERNRERMGLLRRVRVTPAVDAPGPALSERVAF
jgi:hypothetical protein